MTLATFTRFSLFQFQKLNFSTFPDYIWKYMYSHVSHMQQALTFLIFSWPLLPTPTVFTIFIYKLTLTLYIFFMKLFMTSNIETVSCCQEYFGFALPSTLWATRVQKFELQLSNFMYISSCTFSQCQVCYIAHYHTLHIALAFLLIRFALNYYHSW